MEIYEQVLMYVAIYGLIACGVGIFLAAVFAPAWERIRQFFSLPRIQQAVVAATVIGFIQYGSTKHAWYITFSGDGIKQDPSHASVATNNLLEVYWVRDTSGGTIIPSTATVYIDYKEVGNTNATWQTLGSTLFGNFHYSTMVVNATNYCYNVWAYYIPPEPVHTNGVWLYKTLKDRNEKYPLPLRARIEVDGKAIATPAEKRKDEENE